MGELMYQDMFAKIARPRQTQQVFLAAGCVNSALSSRALVPVLLIGHFSDFVVFRDFFGGQALVS